MGQTQGRRWGVAGGEQKEARGRVREGTCSTGSWGGWSGRGAHSWRGSGLGKALLQLRVPGLADTPWSPLPIGPQASHPQTRASKPQYPGCGHGLGRAPWSTWLQALKLCRPSPAPPLQSLAEQRCGSTTDHGRECRSHTGPSRSWAACHWDQGPPLESTHVGRALWKQGQPHAIKMKMSPDSGAWRSAWAWPGGVPASALASPRTRQSPCAQ